MADKKISELTAGGSLQSTDLIPIARSGSTLSVLWSAVTGLFAPLTRSINTGTGLQGGGDLSADRTISMVNVGPGVTGPIGSSTSVPVVTINAQGQVTALTSASISFIPTPDVAAFSLGVDALYKLDEASGTVAHDSSGGGHHLDAFTTDPVFGSTPLQPGTTTASFSASTDSFGGNAAGQHYSPALTGDFAVAGWFLTNGPTVTSSDSMVVTGSPGAGSGANGFQIGINGSSAGPTKHAVVEIGNNTLTGVAQSDSALNFSTGYHLGFTVIRGTWTLYINGVAQASTYSGGYIASGTVLKVGALSASSGGCLMSYVAIFATRGLSASEMAYLASAKP